MVPDIVRRRLLFGLAGASAAAIARPAFASQDLAPNGTFFVRSTDGTRLAVEARGNPRAPEILFIHGLRQSRLSWDKQFAGPALADFRMVRFDLRGHGDSDKPDALDAYSNADLWCRRRRRRPTPPAPARHV